MSLAAWILGALFAANAVVLALALAARRRNPQRVPPAHPRRVNGHGR